MNNNSYICRFMAEHKNWRELLAEKDIAVKDAGDFAILNYGIECDFFDPVVQEARGIIIDLCTLDVACWPFRKFGNFGEQYADEINWDTARVQEKIDGSIVKLWYNHRTDQWGWSTNSMIDAAEAHIMDGSVSFMALIYRADNYRNIPFDRLDKDKTYIFEFVAPEQRIVIRYAYPHLYHIGTRNNITGEESNDDIDVQKPQEFPLHSITDCISAARALNEGEKEIIYEGFVVVDANWHRIKVKSPEYVYAHRIASGRVYTKKRILPIVRAGDGSAEELINIANDSEVYIRYYQWRYAELKRAAGIAISKARAMYEELEHDRRAIADYLKDEPYNYFCFKALGNDMTVEDILAGLPDSAIGKWIKEYVEFDT